MPNIVPVCPVCGGELIVKQVEKIIRRGNDVFFLEVEAGVCTRCSERLYDLETQELFQCFRQGKVVPAHQLRQVGCAYEVVFA